MNCQEALNLLYEIIDKEASEIDAKEVEEHLRNCKDCSGVYRLERSVNELIQEKLAHRQATPKLDTLKFKVLAELDRVDGENRPLSPSFEKKNDYPAKPAFRLGWALAVAASLVVVIGAYFVGRAVFDTHGAYLPLEQSHAAAVDNHDGYSDQATTTLARSTSQQNLSYDVAEKVKTFTLIGGQVETVDNIPLVHFIYHNDDHFVSVFVIDEDLLTVPEELIETIVHRNGAKFYDHNCRGCRLVYRQVGNALIVTASSNRDVDLLDFFPDRNPI